MTEAEWLNATDPQAMLAFLRDSGKLSERKARLFAIGCSRRIWHLLADERSRRAVEVAEAFAEGQVTHRRLTATRDEAAGVWYDKRNTVANARNVGSSTNRAVHAAQAAEGTVWPRGAVWAAKIVLEEALRAGLKRQGPADLLRDLFGPLLFGEIRLDPSWLTWNHGTVQQLARVAYEEREMPSGHLDRTRLAVLADAVEEAGCDQADLLDHLRGPGPCVRGCWVVDLLLAKE